ncbi:hypothetical protein V8F33_002033 [Rhypophila sp. PSN 637]
MPCLLLPIYYLYSLAREHLYEADFATYPAGILLSSLTLRKRKAKKIKQSNPSTRQTLSSLNRGLVLVVLVLHSRSFEVVRRARLVRLATVAGKQLMDPATGVFAMIREEFRALATGPNRDEHPAKRLRLSSPSGCEEEHPSSVATGPLPTVDDQPDHPKWTPTILPRPPAAHDSDLVVVTPARRFISSSEACFRSAGQKEDRRQSPQRHGQRYDGQESRRGCR